MHPFHTGIQIFQQTLDCIHPSLTLIVHFYLSYHLHKVFDSVLKNSIEKGVFCIGYEEETSKAYKSLEKLQNGDIIYIKQNGGIEKAFRIDAIGIVTDTNKYTTSMSLKKCFDNLNKDFKYSHRGCIVNMRKLASVNSDGIKFKNGLHTNLISDMFYENIEI